MATERGHLRDEELQDGLDRRLPPAQMARLEDHLRGCEECRRTWDALSWTKQQAARAPVLNLPEGLANRIAGALDREDALLAEEARRRRSRRLRSVLVAAGLAAMLVLAAVVSRRADPVAAVARDHVELRGGRLALAVRTGDVQQAEAYFTEAGLPFPTRVFDLGMMKFRLVGGTLHRVGGRPSALIVYEGPDGDALICEMFQGSLAELPAGGEAREHDGVRFVVYRRDGLTVVFWPEGDVICVLVGEGSSEAVLSLAFAKAARASAG